MSQSAPREQLTILEAMVLIAGIAFGLWLFQPTIRDESSKADACFFVVIAVLGGLSTAAAPLMLFARRARRRWRSGAFTWFGIGLICWGLVPAIIIQRLKRPSPGGMAQICFIYILPLVGLFFLAACQIAGRPARRWWTCRGWWPEWLGMYVLVGLAAAGVYVMYHIYAQS